MERERQKGETEKYIIWYFEELRGRGYIQLIDTSPCEIVIDYRIEITKGRSFEQWVYTPDLVVRWTSLGIDLWCNILNGHDNTFKRPFVCDLGATSYIEVKPDVAYSIAKANTSAVTFPIRQKALFALQGIYVQMVKPIALFKATFTPQRYMLTDKTLKERKLHHYPRTLDDYLRLTNNLTRPLPRTKDARGEVDDEDRGAKVIDDTIERV